MAESNQMVIFISLHSLSNGEIEVNPSFIMAMERKTVDEQPFTFLQLPDKLQYYVKETPQQISELYMARLMEMSAQMMKMVGNLVKKFSGDDIFGFDD